MFISLSKPIAKIGGFKINAGMRITKNNWYYMLFALLFYWMMMLTVYMMVFVLWLMYACMYVLFKWVKKFFLWLRKLIIRAVAKRKGKEFE